MLDSLVRVSRRVELNHFVITSHVGICYVPRLGGRRIAEGASSLTAQAHDPASKTIKQTVRK
jgi:hypothetical protein